jgi:hypothetical protein
MPDGSHLDVVPQMVCPHLIGTLLEQATPAGLLLVLLLPVKSFRSRHTGLAKQSDKVPSSLFCTLLG